MQACMHVCMNELHLHCIYTLLGEGIRLSWNPQNPHQVPWLNLDLHWDLPNPVTNIRHQSKSNLPEDKYYDMKQTNLRKALKAPPKKSFFKKKSWWWKKTMLSLVSGYFFKMSVLLVFSFKAILCGMVLMTNIQTNIDIISSVVTDFLRKQHTDMSLEDLGNRKKCAGFLLSHEYHTTERDSLTFLHGAYEPVG